VRLTRVHAQALTGDADRWLDALNNALIRWEISTPARVTMFLAQCAHESGGFKHLVENLHYSAAALLATWPKRFTPDEAVAMAYDEQRIGNRAYGGRMGNGDEASGDGYRFRGRGIIQLTGRDNYARAGAAIGLDFVAQPELLEKPDWAASSAGWFWATNGCNALADAGDYEAITRRINGGLNGLADRQAWLRKVQAILGEPAASARAAAEAVPIPTQPVAPIEDHSMPAAPATASQEGSMPFLATLLPMVLQLFAPRAQAELAKVSGNAPAAQALVTELVSQGGKLLNIPTDAQPTNEQGVAVVAALQKAKADNAELVAQLEQHALDYLDKLAPLFDRLQKADEWQRQAELAGRREAAERHVEAERDVVRVVVKEVNGTSRWMLFGVAAGILAAIVARALVKDLPDYVTPLIALAGPLFGQVMKERGAIVAYYFDGTPTSNAAAAINAQIAKVDAQRTGGSQ